MKVHTLICPHTWILGCRENIRVKRKYRGLEELKKIKTRLRKVRVKKKLWNFSLSAPVSGKQNKTKT